MFRWYAVNTYSGHENKVKQNLEHRTISLGPAAQRAPDRHPHRAGLGDEGRPEGPDRAAHDARLRAREHGPERGLLGPRQEHAGRHRLRRPAQKPVPLTQAEIDRLLNRETAERPRTRAQFSIGESVKVVSGPLSDFSGEISEINEDARQAQGARSDLRSRDPGRGRLRPGEEDLAMAKKVLTLIKLQVPGGAANPAPPVGPALGQHGVNIMEFCKAFNAQTQDQNGTHHPGRDHGLRGPLVHLHHEDAAGRRADQAGRRDREGLGRAEPREGRRRSRRPRCARSPRPKLQDLNAHDIDQASKIIAGTARSMGVEVEG